MSALHLSLCALVGTPGRGGRTSLRRSPCLPLCYCLFHAFLWMKDFSKEFYSVLFAACSSTELLSVLHNALTEKEIFTFQSCLSLILYASHTAVIQPTPHNHCSGGVQFSFELLYEECLDSAD